MRAGFADAEGCTIGDGERGLGEARPIVDRRLVSLRAKPLDQEDGVVSFASAFSLLKPKKREGEFGKCFLIGSKKNSYLKKRHTL